MPSKALIVTAILAGFVAASAQPASDQELAIRLAHEGTRRSAVADIVAAGNRIVPLLMSWTQKPPSEVDKYDLYIGLADAFAEMKTRESIPFLIKNLSLRRTGIVDFAPWLKAPAVIESTFPTAAALIAIGPGAADALMRAARGPMLPEERTIAIFIITQMIYQHQSVPEARSFLSSAQGHANLELRWAQEGLKLIDEHQAR